MGGLQKLFIGPNSVALFVGTENPHESGVFANRLRGDSAGSFDFVWLTLREFKRMISR
jgi:hypothetical protein